MSKPIVYDLYSGLHGWLEAFLEGYRCVAFDIVDMCAKSAIPDQKESNYVSAMCARSTAQN